MGAVRFSILVPLFNGEDYIEKCIRSVQNQSCKDWELIVIDDGSKDEGLAAGKKIAESDSKVKFLSQANQGPYMARLNGLREASGEYVLFLDCDDELNCEALSQLNEVIQQNHPDLILFNMSAKPDFSDQLLPYSFGETLFYGEKKRELYEAIVKTSTLNNLASKCVSRSLLLAAYTEEYKQFNNGEDLYVCLSLIDLAKQIVLCNKSLYYYRNNGSSTTHNYNFTFFDSMERVNKKKMSLAEKWGGEALLLEAKRRSCLSCLLVVNALLSSGLSKGEKRQELKRIYSSEFFENSIAYEPLNAGLRFNLLHKLMKRNNQFFRYTLPLELW